MRRSLILWAFLVAGVLLALYLAVPLRRGGPLPPRPPEAPPAAAPPPPPEVLERAAAPSELPISGTVLDADLKGLSGVELALGTETAVSAAGGAFRFAPRRRGERATVILRRGADELARWEGVWVGEQGAGGGGPDGTGPDGTVPDREGPARPGMFRWTINLGPGPVSLPVKPPGEGPGAAFPTVAQVQAVLAEEWGPGGLATILGTSPLPDGAHLDAVLYFDGERFLSCLEPAEVRGGVFRARIPFPDDFLVHSATYRLQLTFGLSLEDPLDLERWQKERPELPWDQAQELVVTREVFIGERGEELEENRKIEGYYVQVLDAVAGLRRLLASRSQRAQEIARGWDPEILRLRAEGRKAWFGDPLLDASGKLDLAAWRRFLDEGFRPEVAQLQERHSSRTGIKYRSAEHLLKDVLQGLQGLSRIESALVYQSLGLPVHPQDFYLDAEELAGDRKILLQIMERELSSLQRFRSLTSGPPPREAEGHSER